VWAQLHYFVELARRGPRSWLAHPAKGQAAAPEVDRASFVKYDVPLAHGRAVYVAVQFLLVIAATTALMLFAPRMPWRSVVAGVALVVASVVALGALVEGRRWAWPVELGRLALIGVYSAAWM